MREKFPAALCGMLKLAPIPHDTPSLHAALAAALAPLGLEEKAVNVEGEFPALSALRLDLTGARIHRGLAFHRAEGASKEAFFVRDLAVKAAPALVETIPVHISIQGNDAVFALAGSNLTLARCGAGTLEIAVRPADLQAALTAAAREAAEKKGAELRSVQLSLRAEGPHVLHWQAEAEAKAMFMTARLKITGRVEVTEAMEVRLSGLQCAGDGMIANLAAGALRPKLAELEGRAYALRALVPNLRNLALDASDGLRIRAELGA